MVHNFMNNAVKLSIVIPCYNEEKTLEECVDRVLKIVNENLSIELIIVDDCSNDKSYSIALDLEKNHSEIKVVRHDKNSGKGAALRTGFQIATGDFVAVQDADLEYDPNDLKRLIVPLIENKADVVFGSRFLTSEAHRVLHFWHSIGNRFLTFLSNMFTDLNLTDMETCYKVFRREIIQGIKIKEDRFGFEPEIVAKIAHKRLRIYEMGISYYGRTYSEGKKIGIKDGFRALYCILRYNSSKAPLPIQLAIYFNIGAVAAVINIFVFYLLITLNVQVVVSAPIAFITAAIVNYLLCIIILFRHKARWNSKTEVFLYFLMVIGLCFVDLGITEYLLEHHMNPVTSKIVAAISLFILNFLGRRFIVFPELRPGPWQQQNP